MNLDIALSLTVIFLYSLGAFGILLGTLAGRRTLQKIANRLALTGFAGHTIAALLIFFSQNWSTLPAGYYMQLLAWCLIFLYLAAWRWFRYPFLGLTAAPLALLLYVLSLRFSSAHNLLPEHLSGLFFGLHIWSLYLSLGMLAMAFGAGLLFIYMERGLKNKTPMAEFTRDMPSLSTCDKVNMIAVVAGFPLYTLGLMAGFIWAPMAQSVIENPKTILSLVIWFFYAVLFYQRAALGLRGRKAALMAIFIFMISVLSVAFDFSVSHHSSQFLP